MSKHTQGPWRIVTDGISHWVEIEPNKIALIHAKKADRDLIAAAPDLLAALEAVIDDLEGYIAEAVDHCASKEWLREAGGRLNNARAAINKATGAD